MLLLRYLSRLLLVGVQRKHSGPYSATAVNNDEVKEVTFNVEVRGEKCVERPLVACITHTEY